MNTVTYETEERWEAGDCCLIEGVAHMLVVFGSSPIVHVLNLETGVVDPRWESTLGDDLIDQVSKENDVIWIRALTIAKEM